MPSVLRVDPRVRDDAVAHWVPAVCGAQPIRLTEVARFAPPGGVPGIYALRYQGPHELYVAERITGSPIYVGSGALRERALCHLRKLAVARDLDPTDFTIGLLETDGPELALLGEQLVINELAPRWNQPEYQGFGSNRVGRGRAGQKDSPWTVLHGPLVSSAASRTPRL